MRLQVLALQRYDDYFRCFDDIGFLFDKDCVVKNMSKFKLSCDFIKE